jgi:hypothetical protein
LATVTLEEAQDAILRLLAQRESGKTICPSEAARQLSGGDDFRPLMGLVREAAGELVRAGRLEVTQQGETVDIDRVKGPIRLRIP